MGLSTQEQVRYWGLTAVVFLAFLWLMGNTLLPFIVGAAIAYLLDPVADKLEARGFSRVAATALITGLAVIFLVLLVLVAVPVMIQQIQALIEAAPGWIILLRDYLSERFPSILDENSTMRRVLAGMEDSLKSGSVAVMQKVLSSSLAVFDSVLLVVLSPVIAFYLLLDWDRMVAKIDDLIPREHLHTVRLLARQADGVLAGFVRGQLTVSFLLGSFYALSLGIIGLQFGVVIGFVAGLISFIPFVGSILGGIISVGVALVQFWGDWSWIIVVGVVFAVGQVVEGNVLTPNLVGDRVKLHPVWLIFALSAFGALLGFSGLLIAVPVAAVIGVLSRFFIAEYKSGRLYKGPADLVRADDDTPPRDTAE